MTVTQFKVLCPASPEKLPSALPQGIMQGLHTLSLLWGLLTGLAPMSKDHGSYCSTGWPFLCWLSDADLPQDQYEFLSTV